MAPRAGLQRNAGDGERGPAQLLACKKAAARPLARRAHANATRPQDTRTAASSRKNPRLLRAPRTSGAADRRADRRQKSAAGRRVSPPPPRIGGTLHTRVPRARHAPRKPLTPRPPRSRPIRRSAPSGRSRRRWPRTGPSPSGSACARATRSAGTRSGGTGAARSSASSRVLKNVFVLVYAPRRRTTG